ncbi:MAG: HAD-IIIA family hydrolase [Niabella sp.]
MTETQSLSFPIDSTEHKEAIVLAGGLGTRLKEAVPDLPKCMAPVAGQPFLYYVINHLRNQGISKIIFSLGYKHEAVLEYLSKEFDTLYYDYVIEQEPLGTGGAVQYALQKTTSENVFVVNGDTLFEFDSTQLSQKHHSSNAACTLGLKPMQDFDRYGAVTLNDDQIITSFKEKQHFKTGLISAGVSLINKASFLGKKFPEKFSFEKDFLEKFVDEGKFAGDVQDVYFIDIGIPEDYNRAQSEFSLPPFKLSDIDETWTLFIDRDGVINEDKVGSYVFNANEFVFMKRMPEIFEPVSKLFRRIMVVTNQRGISKGLMTTNDLLGIHQKMLKGIENVGGKIDKIYFAPGMDNRDFMRKPNPGMALQAKKDFSEINLSKSIMIGNNITDMEFGRNAGMRTIFLTTTIQMSHPNPYIDYIFEDLDAFCKALADSRTGI